MLLSSNVIKRVSCKLEGCSVYPQLGKSIREEELIAEPINQDNIKREAQTILSNAKAQAELLLKQTRERAAIIEKEAYVRAYQKGQEEARQQLEETVRAEFNTVIKQVLDQVEEIQNKIYRETEAELLDLAVSIAEKLVCRQLDIAPDTIVDIVKAACKQARDCKEIILHIPAEQLEIVQSRQDEIQELLYRTEHLAIVADTNIKPGGCWIESEQGYIDARLDSMSEQLETILAEATL